MLSREYLESTVETFKNRFAINVVLALLLCGSIKLGLLLGTEFDGVETSLISPGPGIALAILLLFGFRAWWAVFLGYALYELFNVYGRDVLVLDHLIGSSIVVVGSTIQTLTAALIIRRLSSLTFFETVRDVYIFLFPTALLTCLISGAASVASLAYINLIDNANILDSFLMFYIGDLFGIYVFTPLIVVWLTHRLFPNTKKGSGEGVMMVLAFIVLTFLMTEREWPLGQFYIPMSIWATYRYKMHGATLINFAIATTGLIPTLFGFGAWMVWLSDDQVPILIVYLAAIMGTCLILAAVLNERGRAWKMLEDHNINLESAFASQKEALQEIGAEILVKNKMAYLGSLTLNKTRELLPPLKKIFAYSHTNLQVIREIDDKLKRPEGTNFPELKLKLQQINTSLEEIANFEDQALNTIEVIEQRSANSSQLLNEVKIVNLNTFLNQILHYFKTLMDGINVQIDQNFNRKTPMIHALPEDLNQAFEELMRLFANSLKEKIEKMPDYIPSLEVKLTERNDNAEIKLRDNGEGIRDETIEVLQSLNQKNTIPELNNSPLEIAVNIINYVHCGTIDTESVPGEYLEITVKLPTIHDPKATHKVLAESIQ